LRGFFFGFSWFGGLSGAFIGTGTYFGNFTVTESDSYWFFEFAFCAAAAAIVSGAMTARTRLESYFVFTFIMSSLIYPTVAHWVWNPFGWLAAARIPGSGPLFLGEGFLDFAGSGVVHTCGGFAGLTGAIIVGARRGRFTTVAGKTVPTPNYFTKTKLHIVCNALSIYILWFGWYGFNPGSSLILVGESGHPVAARAALNTTLAPSTAGIVGLILSRIINKGTYNFDSSMNCMLAGLAAITGGCAYVDYGFAILIGAVSAFVYFGASYFILNVLHVDDPLDAFPVHGAGGVWGVLATGFLVSDANKRQVLGGVGVTSLGYQFAVQIIGVLAIIGWTVGTTAFVLGIMAGYWRKNGPNYLYYEPPEAGEMSQEMSQEMKVTETKN